MSEIFNSFIAFNVNGWNYLVYMLTQHWSIALIVLAAVITSILFIKETIVLTVRDEQTII